MISIKDLPEIRGKYREGAILAKRSWFGVGGPADVLFIPEDESDLERFLLCVDKSIPLYILGASSNVLVRDGGIRGVVIKLGRNFSNILINDDGCIEAGASVLSKNLSVFAYQNGIPNFEFLYSIPGSIGGNVWMNAGANGSDMTNILSYVDGFDMYGEKVRFSSQQMGYEYRTNSLLKKYVFTRAVFQCFSPLDKDLIYNKTHNIFQERKKIQPMSSKTGGSTFKNPNNYSAWKLIDEAGCRGIKCGGAMISEKHCNFIINYNNATAEDIEMLINNVIKNVFKNSGIILSLEIKIIGDKKI